MEIYIVATPIGNLTDISNRAIETLSKVDLIFAEDTRVTLKLLKRFNINKEIISFNEHNENKRLEFLNKQKTIKKIALVSDAGTPLISDPGKKIIEFAFEKNFKIIPIPGPSAITTILSVTPFDIKNFVFLGFIEKSIEKKKKLFEKIIKLKYPFIFFDSPNRILTTLKLLLNIDETVNVVIGRELTKVYEQIIFSNILNAINILSTSKIKGEFVVVVSKSSKSYNINEYSQDITILKNLKISTKDIAYFISKKYNISKNHIYNLLKEMEKK